MLIRSHLRGALGACLGVAITCGCAPSPLPDAGRDGATTTDSAAADARTDLTLDAGDSPDTGPGDADTTDGSALDDAPREAPFDADRDAPAGRPDAGDAGPMDGGIVRTDDPIVRPGAPPIAPFTTCTVTTSHDTISGAEHRVPCEELWTPYYPPSSGPHFSLWASFLTYTEPVPWGYLLHSMEHGAVVLAYHCANDADCDPVRAELASIVADRGLDPLCRDEAWMSRIIIVPDPALDVPVAAVAWGHVYRATCLDPTSLRAFVEAHYAMSSESLCAPGVDLSATGWCP